MRVLLTGANGFIGAHLGAALIVAGHSVLGCARDVVRAKRQFPALDWNACDFNKDTSIDDWTSRLDGVDAVINCVGLLQGGGGETLDAVHRAAPVALFDSCAAVGVRRVVQVSAIGADPEAGSEYADSKRATDDYLAGLDLDWVILRPSLVYASGSYGGTSLLRGLAALPFRIPLAGGGAQKFQPIHAEDLAQGVVRLVESDAPGRILLHPCGPQALMVRQIVRGIRRWLGLPAAKIWPIPMLWVYRLARIGDLLRRLGAPVTLTTTAVRQMEYGALADPQPFVDATGVTPRSFAAGLAAMPSFVQDRWHARLYFVRPLLRILLGLSLVATGLHALPTLVAIASQTDELLLALREKFTPFVVFFGGLQWATSLLAAIAGLLLLFRWRARSAQLLAVLVTLLLVVAAVGNAATNIAYAPNELVGANAIWIWIFAPIGPVRPLLLLAVALFVAATADER